MADEKKEPWMSWLALTTVVLAVCATFSTFKGGGHSTASILSQNKASNQWSYFQSKSIKGYLFEVQKEQYELQLGAERDKMPEEARKEYEKKVAKYGEQIKRYEGEKAEIKKEAEKHELDRDQARLHSGAFGKAVIYLQIAILLASIAALLKRKPIYYVGLAAGAWGLVNFVNGFMLFM